jgi:hypothetical protein
LERFFKTIKAMVNSIPGKGILSSFMLLSSIFAPFSSFPPLHTYITSGRDKGLYVLLSGVIATFLLGGVEAGIIYVVVIVLCSVVTAELLLSKCSFGKTVFYGSIIMIGIYAFVMVLYSLIFSVNIMEFMNVRISEALTYIEASNPEIVTQMLRESGMTRQELITSIVVKVPSAVVLGIVLLLFINLVMMTRFDRRLSDSLSIQSLYNFKVSDHFIWPTIAFGALFVFTGSELNTSVALKTIAILLFKSILIVYFFQGLAIMYLYLTNGIKSLFFRSLLFSVIIVFAYIFITVIGFFDTWFDFRKHIKSKDDKGEIK